MERIERLTRLNTLVDQLMSAYNDGQTYQMDSLYKRINFHLSKIDKEFSTELKLSICTTEELLLLNQFNVKYGSLRKKLDNTIRELDTNMRKFKQQHNKIAYGYFAKSTQIKSRHLNLSCK